MANHEMKNARLVQESGVSVAGGVQADAALESGHKQDHSASPCADSAKDVLTNKSTSTEIQLEKLLVLLRTGPKTTIQLRDNGIMMPAAQIHHLRHVDGHTISAQLVTLYDANGFRHSKCARYHLEAEAPGKDAA